MVKNTTEYIITYLKEHPSSSSKDIYDGLKLGISYSTVKRLLSKLVDGGVVYQEGKLKGTKYFLRASYLLFYPINVEEYFLTEIDERKIKNNYNLELVHEILEKVNLFSTDEEDHLQTLHQKFKHNISHLSENAYQKELERLAIDLSWKSSQIEGNTYSLLETERLLKEKETAAGKPKDDATMLLNHKDAINFIIENPNYTSPLTISSIEDIHNLLTKELYIDRNIRRRRVGISGTNYTPLDNEYQIRDALNEMCNLVNVKENIFEKALLTLVLLSYIQPFVDGNKRTARIVSNSILLAGGYCPLSFRTVDSISYKKAMLIFYEQNNIKPFKDIFIAQYEFAVGNYF
ncbi:MAG: Fic family protein [Bacteroidota bacterium]